VEFNSAPKAALQHNMLARLTLPLRQGQPALAVPVAAVLNDGSRSFVFVQKADSSFDRRLVLTGRNDDRYIEIVSGLQALEPVVVAGVAEMQTAYAGVR